MKSLKAQTLKNAIYNNCHSKKCTNSISNMKTLNIYHFLHWTVSMKNKVN